MLFTLSISSRQHKLLIYVFSATQDWLGRAIIETLVRRQTIIKNEWPILIFENKLWKIIIIEQYRSLNAINIITY